MDLKHLSSRELHEKTKLQASRVRQEITVLLHHLAELDRRRFYLELACESLFAYCVRHLEMSEPQAARYLNAARALREFPEIEEKISSGTLTMTAVSQAQTFFKREEKANHKFSSEEKRELLQKIENQSTRETERILISHSQQPEPVVVERVRLVTESISELKVSIDAETFAHLQRLKEIWSHEMPGASFSQIIRKMAKLCRETHDPLLKAKRAKATGRTHRDPLMEERREKGATALNAVSGLRERELQPPLLTPAPESNELKKSTESLGSTESTEIEARGSSSSCQTSLRSSEKPEGTFTQRRTASRLTRAIPAAVRHRVYRRDGGACTYVDPVSGLRCPSRHLLELDHIRPYGMGGCHTVENLRLRCREHNQLHARRSYVRDGIIPERLK